VSLTDGGANAPKLGLNLKLDEQDEFQSLSTVEMSEHIQFAKPEEFVKRLEGRTTLHVGFEGPNKKSVTMDFDVDGIEGVLDKLGSCDG
jgi:hypothetical protein